MAYFVIMSTTLYSAVQGVLDLIFADALTPVPGSGGHERHFLTEYWQHWMTPLIILVLVMPLTQIKTLAVLVKVNSGGVLCVVYLVRLCVERTKLPLCTSFLSKKKAYSNVFSRVCVC
jgi:hypothetical protein